MTLFEVSNQSGAVHYIELNTGRRRCILSAGIRTRQASISSQLCRDAAAQPTPAPDGRSRGGVGVHATCGLTLSVSGVCDRVRQLDGAGAGAARTFRLAKQGDAGRPTTWPPIWKAVPSATEPLPHSAAMAATRPSLQVSGGRPRLQSLRGWPGRLGQLPSASPSAFKPQVTSSQLPIYYRILPGCISQIPQFAAFLRAGRLALASGSCLSYHCSCNGLGQSGRSALGALHAGGRRFESVTVHIHIICLKSIRSIAQSINRRLPTRTDPLADSVGSTVALGRRSGALCVAGSAGERPRRVWSRAVGSLGGDGCLPERVDMARASAVGCDICRSTRPC
jgi:hypothetical protein